MTFTSPGHLFADYPVTINSELPYLALAQTTHAANGSFDAYDFDIGSNTNLPTGQLSASIASNSASSMITGASIVTSPSLALRVSVARNLLVAGETAIIEVTWGSVTRQLEVTIPAVVEWVGNPDDDHLVYLHTIGVNSTDLVNGNYTCPTGSSLTRSEAETIWYMTYMHELGVGSSGFYHMTWEGSPPSGPGYKSVFWYNGTVYTGGAAITTGDSPRRCVRWDD